MLVQFLLIPYMSILIVLVHYVSTQPIPTQVYFDLPTSIVQFKIENLGPIYVCKKYTNRIQLFHLKYQTI